MIKIKFNNKEQVNKFVEKGIITEQEYNEMVS